MTIFFSNEDMEKGVIALLEKVRFDIVEARGKLGDIKSKYHWDDRIEVSEHGLTLVISHLFGVIQEIEEKQRDQEKEG